MAAAQLKQQLQQQGDLANKVNAQLGQAEAELAKAKRASEAWQAKCQQAEKHGEIATKAALRAHCLQL